jgi:hypothetical protein
VASTVAAAMGINASAEAKTDPSVGGSKLPMGFAPNIVFVLTDDGPRNSYGVPEGAFTVVGDRYKGHWLGYPNASCNEPVCAPRAGRLHLRGLRQADQRLGR